MPRWLAESQEYVYACKQTFQKYNGNFCGDWTQKYHSLFTEYSKCQE